jgi:hypothetical protein
MLTIDFDIIKSPLYKRLKSFIPLPVSPFHFMNKPVVLGQRPPAL